MSHKTPKLRFRRKTSKLPGAPRKRGKRAKVQAERLRYPPQLAGRRMVEIISVAIYEPQEGDQGNITIPCIPDFFPAWQTWGTVLADVVDNLANAIEFAQLNDDRQDTIRQLLEVLHAELDSRQGSAFQTVAAPNSKESKSS